MRIRFITAILLALVLFLLCAGALAAIEPGDVIGTWYMTGMQVADAIVSPALMGMEMSMVLEEDNTTRMEMVFGGEEDSTTGTWSIAGDLVTITAADGTSIVCTLADGELNGEQGDGPRMVFSREKGEEAVAFEASPVRDDAVLADFNGTWNATILESAGTQLPVGAIGFDTTLTIENGKATMENVYGSDESEGAVADGVLMLFAANGAEIQAKLHVDGTLSCVLDESTTMYFEKASE